VKAAVVVAAMALAMLAGGVSCGYHALATPHLYLFERMAFGGVAAVLIFNGAVGMQLAWQVRR
jgi:hypothetical protein